MKLRKQAIITKEMLEPFNLIKVPIYYITGTHEDLTWKEEFLELISSLISDVAREMYTPKNLSNLICECLLANDVRKSGEDFIFI